MFDFKSPQLKIKFKWKIPRNIAFTILISCFFGVLAGTGSSFYFYSQTKDLLASIEISEIQRIIEKEKVIEKEYIPQISQEEAIVDAVKNISPSVVSIIITKDLPIIEKYYYNSFEEFEEFFEGDPFFELQVPQYEQKGIQRQEVGGGTGFIVSEGGMIVTNKHVVLDEDAEYTILTNDGKEYPAEVLALDPVQDLAVMKIKDSKQFSAVKFGNSDDLQIGQTVIAIGNSLGEFKNTVSVGVISGLGRTITASRGDFIETLEDIIQTDAAINKGNSGGPLLNLKGEVIGINTATVLGAQSIGFAIPIDRAKRDVEQVKILGKIVYPFLGIRYILITERIKEDNDLSINYGALITRGKEPDEYAIYPGSVAEEAGLKEGDIVLEMGGEKIALENSLAKVIQKHNPGDKITLKILSEGNEKNISVVLGER